MKRERKWQNIGQEKKPAVMPATEMLPNAQSAAGKKKIMQEKQQHEKKPQLRRQKAKEKKEKAELQRRNAVLRTQQW